MRYDIYRYILNGIYKPTYNWVSELIGNPIGN